MGNLEPTGNSLIIASLRLGTPSLAEASGAAVLLSGLPLTVAPLSFLRLP